jgi:uncharacterized protein YbjT (DUF2867 family)
MKIAVAGATGRVGRHAVDVLTEAGREVAPMSRATGVDVITGEGIAEALDGVESVIDVATTGARNLQEFGERSGVKRIVTVSIIGTDHFTAGYGAAKIAHEQATLSGPIPAHILRAAQFHEFVSELVNWGRQGEVSRVPEMRTQLVAARAVAEELANLATQSEFAAGSISEIAGPREESLVEMAKLLVARRGDQLSIEGVVDQNDPEREVNLNGALLPGPDAKLAGPTFEEWLESGS